MRHHFLLHGLIDERGMDMYRLILISFLICFSCKVNSSTGTSQNEIIFLGSNFSYEPNTVTGFQKKPFAQTKGDTLIINDYWAMSQQPALKAEASMSGDSIILQYSKVPMSVETDWSPTVETVSRFVGKLPMKLTITIEPAPKAREPLDSERTEGFRDARQVLVETVQFN